MCINCGCSDDNTNFTILDTNSSIVVGSNLNSNSYNYVLSNKVANTNSNNKNGHEILESHTDFYGSTIPLEYTILSKNNLIASKNRGWLKTHNIIAINLMSSPGSGKTTLLTRTINDLKNTLVINVIEGDQETINDAKKIKDTGCEVIQINTGQGCHLDASMIEGGLEKLNPSPNSLVMIENVGNLVCPALFDLGENLRVVILSVTEGEDKPIKYPHIFRTSNIMILTKIDLLPYVQFDIQKCIDYAQNVNPHIRIFQVSSQTGIGLDSWYKLLCNLFNCTPNNTIINT
ncbi:[NiFe] hydrogenase nickel incorporation-associated protein HypB [Richelia intracellularis HH01]|uniref:[NiFe] hydrogenase nickel incorporation-associated protein HypB n=1 Tax=Richelia intracellularis HH01 TaxID=1165094 RepID=M1X1G4_9NOST|nr:hydrogenase nickel incorporation protein HypB [Richelia intracellularis]CCH68163.1 [NiFe] hydrogenase nickel incorporation-associated protein HypB [Richelia intracellularis HH01]HAE05570.1 hydrogenase accessory protein HypB [Richelia sp.]